MDASLLDAPLAARDEADNDAPVETRSALPLRPGVQEDLVIGKPGQDEPTEAPEGALDAVIAPGRMLALADFAPPRLSAGERFLRLAYKLGVPGQALARPFSKAAREKLTAAADNPLGGDKVAGTALRAGHFLLHGVKLPVSQADFGGVARMVPPMERYVHSFAWLADLEAAAPREQCVPVAERVLGAWLDANPKEPKKPGKAGLWTVDSAGTRLLNWLVHAPLILSGDKKFRGRAMAAITGHARWLDRHVERGEDLLARFAGWSAITAAGLLLSDGKPRRLFGEAGLVRAIGEMVGDDGGTLSRSPLAQIEAIELLVRLGACYRAVRRDPPEAIAAMQAMLVPPLLALTHGDGSLGSWQGGWAIGADQISRLIEASGARTRPLRDVRQWGYQRAVAGKSVLQFDTAPPPLARHARTGCASTLAFELSHAGQRLIVNCGGAAAAGGLIPARLDAGLRATAAHSTLVLDDSNSTAVLIGGKIGAGVNQVDIERRTLEGERGSGATRIEASHDGYASRYGLIHRRILILRDDGTELRGEDLLVPAKGKGSRGKVAFAIRFHLGAGIDARLSEDRQGAGLALPDGTYWQFRSGGGEVQIEDSLWADKHGRPVAIQQLVVQGLASRGGGNFAWLLKKMG
ncbi:heparinase II/III family protein [Novosphingobium sp. MW5]|nr:heparinase II/III family protein [Novosphingobium sp. MW5]